MSGKKHSQLLVRYRFARKAINASRADFVWTAKSRYRMARKARFKTLRLAVFNFFKLWIREIDGLENIPKRGPAIFICNHLSYYDFLIFGSIMRDYIVFLAQKKINETFFVKWFTRFHNVVYVDKDKPGTTFFKNVIKYLESKKMLMIYPEGTRSRSGKMLAPKPGFVKLAMRANVPIIPVALKGTYEILPPHRHIPRLRKCKVVIGKKIYISPENPDFSDIFFRRKGERKFGNLTDEEMQEVAIILMNKIRMWSEQEWDGSAREEINKLTTNVVARSPEGATKQSPIIITKSI